jgi:bacterioferritin-associated ferredoxin
MDELRRDLGLSTCCGQCAGVAEEILNEHLGQLNETVLKRPSFSE